MGLFDGSMSCVGGVVLLTHEVRAPETSEKVSVDVEVAISKICPFRVTDGAVDAEDGKTGRGSGL
jgi:hypothetical protein